MAPTGTILIVDDEQDIITLMQIYLLNEGYRLLTASNGLEAIELLSLHPVDVVILDVMMPHLDGIETCIQIRKNSDVPVIMLSAKSQDIDKIRGLSIGADDYVTKPFNPLELVARIKSQIRRYNRYRNDRSRDDGQFEIDDLVVNVSTHKVSVDGQEVKLTPREFAILHMLAVNRDLVMSIERIYEEVWQEPYVDSKNTVMVHIRKLREKIERDPQRPRYIKTIWGIGYKLES
ncbi:response regulator transcription factor [Cohnella sp. JJ-181]|uniref:response regulator transcription factor n=1 Tax=Cohnella rhizoplanae TaxID=2974897 RepID=UPI0022FF7FBF|nr:response regulator transcription factor [Cohnella sp. JJ-181]CAI6051744.1 Transcriptional regulatory protein WalR [Cohnella sp. JJ-181]